MNASKNIRNDRLKVICVFLHSGLKTERRLVSNWRDVNANRVTAVREPPLSVTYNEGDASTPAFQKWQGD